MGYMMQPSTSTQASDCDFGEIIYNGDKRTFPYEGVRTYYVPIIMNYYNLYLAGIEAWSTIKYVDFRMNHGLSESDANDAVK